MPFFVLGKMEEYFQNPDVFDPDRFSKWAVVSIVHRMFHYWHLYTFIYFCHLIGLSGSHDICHFYLFLFLLINVGKNAGKCYFLMIWLLFNNAIYQRYCFCFVFLIKNFGSALKIWLVNYFVVVVVCFRPYELSYCFLTSTVPLPFSMWACNCIGQHYTMVCI